MKYIVSVTYSVDASFVVEADGVEEARELVLDSYDIYDAIDQAGYVGAEVYGVDEE